MKCCVLSCKNYSDRQSEAIDGISFHVFPSEDSIRQEWIAKINRPHWTPTKHTKICSHHFYNEDFKLTKKGLKRFRHGVSPSLKLGHRTSAEPRNNSSECLISNESPRSLIQEIAQLRSKARTDGLKIRSLQMKVCRLKKKIDNQPEASTNTAAGHTRTCLNTEKGSTSLNLVSDDEPTGQYGGDSDGVHCTSNKESQKGRFRLSGGSAGSLLPETPVHALQQELLMDLHEISDKIQNFYPAALGKQFTLAFKGEDGDKSEYVFTSASETRRSGERHTGLRCNECGSNIMGFRYKCVSCADYDLCSACEALGTHAYHLMMRIAKPLKLKQARSLLQRWCEVMKTTGVTTIDSNASNEITGTNTGSVMSIGTIHTTPTLITAKSPIDIVKTQNDSKQTRVEAKKRKTLGESEAIKKIICVSERESRAQKQMIDVSEVDSTEVQLTVKEEPLENTNLTGGYSCFNETEMQVEEIKVEGPDPLSTGDIVKTEDTEDVNSSPAPPGFMEVVTSSI